MYIWGRNAMELYGMSLGKHRSPWNIVEGGVGKHGLHRGKVPEVVQSTGKRGKRFGVMVGSGGVYSVPVPPFKIVPTRHYSILSTAPEHLGYG